MDKLEKYEAVNKCETLQELANVIESFADLDGYIQGRQKRFSAKSMAFNCRNYNQYQPNVLTREFGIRQQALYILFYNGEFN